MSDDKKATAPVQDAASRKRSKTMGTVAALAGVVAALVALVGVVWSKEVDLIYVLLFAGGMLVSVLGFRRMRQAGKG